MPTARNTAAARRPRQIPTTPPETAPPAPPSLALAGDDDTGDDALARMLAEYGGADGYRIRLERVERTGAEYLGTLDFVPDLLDDVKAQFGGGKYRGRVVNPAQQYVTRIAFNIAGPAKSLQDDAAAARPVAAVDSRTDRLEAAIESLARVQADTLRELAASRQADKLDDLVKLSQVLKAMAPPPAAASNVSEIMTLVTGVLELRDTIVGGAQSEPSSELGAIVRDGVKPLLDVMQRSMTLQENAATRRRLPGAPPAPGAPAANTGAPPNVAIPAARTPAHEIAARIPMHARAFLLARARAGNEPEVYADMALDFISTDDCAAMRPMLDTPEFLGALVEVVPAFAAHREWFGAFCRALAEAIDNTAAGDEAPEGDATA